MGMDSNLCDFNNLLNLKIIHLIMDPDITHTLLKYDSQVSEWRNKFLKAKTV